MDASFATPIAALVAGPRDERPLHRDVRPARLRAARASRSSITPRASSPTRIAGALCGAAGQSVAALLQGSTARIVPWAFAVVLIVLGLGLEKRLPQPRFIASAAPARAAAIARSAGSRRCCPCGPLWLMLGAAAITGIVVERRAAHGQLRRSARFRFRCCCKRQALRAAATTSPPGAARWTQQALAFVSAGAAHLARRCFRSMQAAIEQRVCIHCGTPFRPDGAPPGFLLRGLPVRPRPDRQERPRPVLRFAGRRRAAGAIARLPKARLHLAARNSRRDAAGALTLDVQGLSCIGCAWLIERLFTRQPGALAIHVDPTLGQLAAPLAARRRSMPSRLRASCKRSATSSARPANAAAPASRALNLRLGLCAALAMNTMLFTLPRYLGMASDFEFAPLFQRLTLILGTLSFLIGGSYFFIRSWRSLRQRVLHIDLPISLGLHRRVRRLGLRVGARRAWLRLFRFRRHVHLPHARRPLAPAEGRRAQSPSTPRRPSRPAARARCRLRRKARRRRNPHGRGIRGRSRPDRARPSAFAFRRRHARPRVDQR